MTNTLTRGASAPVAPTSQVEQVLDAVRSHTSQPLTGRVAALIAEAPFLAGSPRPAKDALHGLLIYAAAQHGPIHRITDHSPLDDANVLERIRPMIYSSGGDLGVMSHVAGLLGLILVEGYQRDLDKDKASGDYNPILAEVWSYQEKKSEMVEMIERNFSPAVDGVMSVREAEKMGWGG